MPVYRYSVLVWEDYNGNFTAVPVEDLDEFGDSQEEFAGIGRTEKEALGQLKAFLTWMGKKNGELPEPSIRDVDSLDFVVPIRPESRDGRRTYPSEYRIRTPFTCVRGRLSEELHLASAPYIGLRFRYFSRDNLKNLFIHKVRGALKEMDTLALLPCLPPASSRLAEVSVKIPAVFKRVATLEDEFETLVQVAEPLDARQRKRRAGPAWEREKEITDLVTRLREEKTNILLTGENGAGKTTIDHHDVQPGRRGRGADRF